jgi:hypothetical protein
MLVRDPAPAYIPLTSPPVTGVIYLIAYFVHSSGPKQPEFAEKTSELAFRVVLRI